MNIEYVGRNFELDGRVRAYTETKLKKALKFLAEPVEVRVKLEVEKHRQIAELHISHRRGVLHATEENTDILDAINLAVDSVEKQARRGRKKAVDQRRRGGRNAEGALEWPLEVMEAESVRSGTPRIIKSTAIPIKPMTIEEAALALEDSRNEFVVFLDAISDRVSVLYKRKDQHYGLIAPEF